jgi:hypothetical protein
MSALRPYEEALGITERMLACARAAQWDRLVELEKERAGAMATLRLSDPDPGRDAVTRDRKRVILERMIACDEEISVLTQDWMRELRQVLSSVDTTHKLERTYGSG